MKKYLKNISEQGSMMVEALAMLGLITMVTPILYKKAAERTTELQDINTATQLRTVSKALDDYIKDNYSSLDEDIDENQAANIDQDVIKDYLPYNFETKSKLFNDFSFSIKKSTIPAADGGEGTASFTGVVLAPLANEGDLPRIRASKIASMVGANGGIVEGTDIKGVQGTWNAPVADFIFKDADGDDIDVQPNSLAISSVHAVTSSSGTASEAAPSEDVLHRTPQDDPILNTMETALLMGGNDIKDVVKIIAKDENGITLDGKVTVKGDVEAVNITASEQLKGTSADIAELLKAGSAEIGSTLKVTGLSTLVGGVKTDTITANTDGSPITLSSDVKANEKLTVTKLLTGEGGIVAKGTAETVDEKEYALVVKENNLLVENNALIQGSAEVQEDLIANSLYGDTEIGGGNISEGQYNFVATKDGVTIAKNSFSIGTSGSERIKTDDNSVNMAAGNINMNASSAINISAPETQIGTTEGSYITIKNTDDEKTISASAIDSIELKSGTSESGVSELNLASGEFTLTSGNVGLEGNDTSFSLSTPKAGIYGEDGYLSMSATGENENYSTISTTDESISMDLYNSSGSSLGYVQLYKDADGLTKFAVDTSNFDLDEDNLIFYEDKVDETTPASSGVWINRHGIIELASAPSLDGTAKDSLNSESIALGAPGYILADRLVSNVEYPQTGGYWGVGDGDYNSAANSATNVSKRYDAYQVNPAYTSVMHDIKLTTRGGARLSDILPDFINKGIYVLDNTYQESNDSKNWEEYTVTPSSGSGNADEMVGGKPGECSSPDCIASPWLGFVPTPQCPPGYSKVITISPIRWKMSEAYYVIGTESINASTLRNNPEDFRVYFQPALNPLVKQIQIEVTEDENNKHNANFKAYDNSNSGSPDYAFPLTFQTNTWLNTTISGVYSDKDSQNTADGSGSTGGQRLYSFVGWHAIMGFLYPADDYEDYLTGLGEWNSDWKGNGTIIWNLFPVYNEEMTAIANVYCYFERRTMTDEPTWEWDSSYVDGGDSGYNQLNNFRFGFEKDNEAYNERLNDPALGYDEVW